jgi:HAD superfamily phosphoserine phosphatase-like hydrolase
MPSRSTVKSPKAAFDRVVFDADSTLSAIEGIDELARLRGIDVSDVTKRAMTGEIPLETVYRRRLERIRPSVKMVAFVGGMYVERCVHGAKPTIDALHRAGAEVWVVSGAIRQAVVPLTHFLGIPGNRVFAVDIFFDTRGRYAGFDESSRLATSQGKRLVLEDLRDPRVKTVFIGDGATDLAAAPAVDAFVAFTGVAHRENVAAAATASVNNFSKLRRLLGLPSSR